MSGSGSPTRYEIRIEGNPDSRWAAWFEDLQLESEGQQTVISGLLADQSALHGLLVKVRDLGLCLISMRRMDTDQAEAKPQQYDTSRIGRPTAGQPTEEDAPPSHQGDHDAPESSETRS